MRILGRLAVLALAVALTLGAWSWSRSYLAHRIGSQAEALPQTARVALSEMSKLGETALPALLDAAISPDRQVSRPARQEVEAIMIRRAARRGEPVDDLYQRVIEGVKAREPMLTPSGRRWVRQLGETALRLASGSQDGVDPRLVKSIEQLFVLSQGHSRVSDLPLPPPELLVAAPVNVQPRAGPRESPKLQTPPVDDPIEQGPRRQPSQPTASRQRPGESGELSDSTLRVPQPFVVDIVPPSSLAKGPANLRWQSPNANDPGAPGAARMAPRPIGPDAAAPDQAPKATVGAPVAKPVPEQVAKLLSGDTADKLLLVEQLQTGRHENAVPLLFQLAKDPAARVRASAISALGSSPNRRLTEAAWRLALNDQDPKVARLAGELQKLIR